MWPRQLCGAQLFSQLSATNQRIERHISSKAQSARRNVSSPLSTFQHLDRLIYFTLQVASALAFTPDRFRAYMLVVINRDVAQPGADGMISTPARRRCVAVMAPIPPESCECRMLRRIFTSTLSTMLFSLLFVLLLATATALLRYLARARIPPALEPLAVRWENAGFNSKSFRLLLWGCFWFLALIFFAAVGYGLYLGAMGLGRDFK
jgi:hypothetical protein